MISKEEMLALADNMASAASSLNTMTYDQLMSNRKQLIDSINEVYENAEISGYYKPSEWTNNGLIEH